MAIGKKVYKCRLTVETPTHIGTGEAYYGLDFVIKDGKFYLVDKDKFLKSLSPVEQKEFIRLSLSENPISLINLRNFIKSRFKKEYALDEFPIDEKVEKEIEEKFSSIAKTERSRGKIINVINKVEIRKIFKDSLTLKPVIPGSSLKGSIRTAVLSRLFKLYKENNDISKIKEIEKNIENILLSSYSVKGLREKDRTSKDLFRFIKVSDFYPIDDTRPVIGKAEMNHLRKGKEGLYTYLEYIKPKTVFEGTIIVDEEMAAEILKNAEGFPFSKIPLSDLIDINKIMIYLRAHYGKYVYYENERKYPGITWKLRANKHKLESPLKIGFHSGSLAVTICDDKIRKIWDRKAKKIKNKPLTFWTINSKPMGWCYLEVLNASKD